MQDEDLLIDIAEQTPAGRIATPEDVAAIVAFLCSPDASMIRGQTLIADGWVYSPSKRVTEARLTDRHFDYYENRKL